MLHVYYINTIVSRGILSYPLTMTKRRRKYGSKYYTREGLKPITIFVEKELHKKLKALAEEQELALFVSVRRILEEHVYGKASHSS